MAEDERPPLIPKPITIDSLAVGALPAIGSTVAVMTLEYELQLAIVLKYDCDDDTPLQVALSRADGKPGHVTGCGNRKWFYSDEVYVSPEHALYALAQSEEDERERCMSEAYDAAEKRDRFLAEAAKYRDAMKAAFLEGIR